MLVLCCHGWPESLLGVTKILPLLAKGGMEHPAIHVIAPALPIQGSRSGMKRKCLGKGVAEVVVHERPGLPRLKSSKLSSFAPVLRHLQVPSNRLQGV